MIPVVTAVGHRPHHGGSERGGNTFSARLVGYQEVPSKSSIARGTFQARWDEGAQVLRYTLSYADLEAPALFAHIHFGQRHTNGDISAFLCGGGTKPAPCPSPSGTVTGEIREADVVGPAAQGIDGLPPGPAK